MTESGYVFVDRDGVLNVDRQASVRDPAELSVVTTAPEAVRMLNQQGYGVIVLSNQAVVGRGHLQETTLEAIHGRLIRIIGKAGGRLERIYVCPHRPEENCECRKPRPGLIYQAHRDYGMNLSQTWLVGDSMTDVEAALAGGCLPALVLSGKTKQAAAPGNVPVFRDLLHFAKYLGLACEPGT